MINDILKKTLIKIGAAMFLYLPCHGAYALKCAELSDPSQLPLKVESSKCYEIVSDGTFNNGVEISGQVIIKAGSSVTLAKANTLNLKRRGSLTVRGELIAEDNSTLNLELMSSFLSQGRTVLKADTTVNLGKSSTFKSIGALEVFPQSLFALTDNAKVELSARSVFDNALISMKGGNFENKGTLEFSAGSRIIASKNAILANHGRFTLSSGSAVTLSGSSQLSNRRNILLQGSFSFADTASCVNYGIFEVEQGGSLLFSDGASLGNQHVMNLKGFMSMSDHSAFENRNGLKIYASGLLELDGSSRLINRGSIYNDGGMATSGEAVFDNRKFYFDARNKPQEQAPAVPRQGI